LRLKDIKAKGGEGHSFTADETKQVIEPLMMARNYSRSDVKNCIAFIQTCRDMGKRPPENFLRWIASACRAHPDDFRLLGAAIPFLRKFNMNAEADGVLAATAQCILSKSEIIALEKMRSSESPAPSSSHGGGLDNLDVRGEKQGF